jgi:PKD repeat protein
VRCVNQSIQFTDLSQTNGGGSLTVWNWNFDDPGSGINNISTLQNPTHTFATAGSYQVRLIVQNVSGCADTIIKTVDINALPAPDFAADTACFGTPTQFTDLTIPNAPSIIVYNWDFGDGTPPSPLQNPAHTYATYGYFTVTLTVTNSNGCVNSISKQVLVNPLPIAEFSFSTPNCFGAVVNFTNLSSTVPGYLGSIVNWTWDFGDGTTTVVWFPGNPNVSHTFVGPALSHTVRLTVKTSDSCESWVEHIVTSIPSPVANFTYSGTSCADQVVQFTDLSQENGGGSIIFWYWNFDDPGSGSNNTSNAQNPLHVFTAPGTYDVMLIITNTSNCTDTIIQPVNVNLLPVANFTADTACLGNPTNFVDGSTPNAAGMSSWLWDFGDGTPTSGQQNPSHIYANYGYYTVTLTVVNTNGCVHTTSKQVMVRPLPIPEFSYSTPNCVGAVVQFTDLSTTVPGYLGPIQTWLWDFGDGTTTTVTWPANPNVSHTFVGGATSHTVRLTVTTVNGCTAFIEHIVNSIPSPLANFSFPNNNCADQAVQFTDISQPNGGGNIISWLWNFDDPPSGINNTSTAQNPIHYFTAPGTYDVVLIIANTSGCTDTVTYPVTVVALPVANFTADTACLGALTSFTDLSTSSAGTIASHLWDFGDGQTSTASNPTHLYGSAGTYNVKLTVTTTFGCIKDTTKAVQVLGAAVAAFSATTPTCAGDSVQFTDLSSTPNGSIIQWVWNFGDGNTVTINYPASPNVRHLYASGGTYNVTLTITTSLGCTASKTNPVVVEPAPLANFDYASTRCEQMPVQFTDLTQPNGGSAIASWLWNFGDPASGSANTSNIQNPTHSFSTSGTFTVLLTVTNANGCHDSISKSVSVNQAPVAQFTADTACLGLPTSFTDQSTPNATSIIAWNWNFGDPSSGTNNTSTAQNPTHVFTSTGLFLVTLSVTNSNSCVDDTVIEINVNPAPDAMFSADASCVNTPTQFTDLSIAPGSAIVAWFWDFGDGTGTSTEQNPTYTYTAPGTYDVKLVVTNLSNCQDSIIIPVISRPTPIAAFTYVNFFCPAGQVNFQDQSQGVGAAIVDHLWIFEPGSTSNGVNPQYTYSITDTTYLVTLIVTDNYGCKDTIVDSVYVKPGFSFTFNNDTVCHGYPTHFQAVNLADGDSLYSPFWDFGDPASGPNNFSYQYNPQHTFTQPGSYVVKLRVVNSDNCVDSIYRYVSVFALPEPDFSFISTPCDSIIHFRDLTLAGGGTIITWEWFFGDGTPPVVITGPGTGDTSHLYTAVGTYNVTLVTTNSNGCVDSLTKVVELYPCIKATFTHDDTLLCARYNIAFSDSSLPVSIINEWHWFWGDGQDTLYTVHAPVVTHRYADAGTYNVDLVIRALVNSTTFRDTARQQIVIHPTPLTLFSNTGVCMEQITLFSDTSTTFGEPISTWSWTFGEPTSGTADTSTFRNPGHQYDTAGIYDVKLIVMNKYGCKDSLTKPTRVYGLPVAQFSSSIGCNGNPTYFYDGSQTADTLMAQWLWNFGDPNSQLDISDQENPIYIYRSEGQYLVTMIVEDYFGCRDTVDSTITVHLTPTSSFTITENINGMIGKIELNNISVGADAYYWDFGNGQTSEEINPIVTYSEDGTYIIMLISTNQYECSDTTFYSYEVLFKGLYIPNAFAPTSTNYAVKNFQPVGVGLKLYNIQVFDIWGNLVWESNKLDSQGRPTEGWNGKVNGVMCPSGTYMWKASATFVDDTIWEGSDIGKGEAKTIGTVTLIR